MSLGKPIVATAVGGIPEAISDGVNGLLVKPDVGQIAEAINHLLTDRTYADELGNAQKALLRKNSHGNKQLIDSYFVVRTIICRV
jgi:glycosyltransferase involved in cell wall biosynthesis